MSKNNGICNGNFPAKNVEIRKEFELNLPKDDTSTKCIKIKIVYIIPVISK